MAAKFADWGRLFPLRLRPSPRAWLSGGGDEYGGDYQLLRQRRPKPPPKGHLVVYVPRDGGERPHRAVVPVVYFNHPLFGELLRKVETEFGFQQSGGSPSPARSPTSRASAPPWPPKLAAAGAAAPPPVAAAAALPHRTPPDRPTDLRLYLKCA
ncbi:unnamed protein product [Spirodela intermedia]|uniref:Uncharacterized protein n=1 Tax=Spirodela intermedia TaxID=51605 RepID=A0A7I8J9G9_SPIIN|nr:unnamed protein product [Spirodela intermedia]CAA6666817.1 unnamed protein product [Spirodela intermedia]